MDGSVPQKENSMFALPRSAKFCHAAAAKTVLIKKCGYKKLGLSCTTVCDCDDEICLNRLKDATAEIKDIDSDEGD